MTGGESAAVSRALSTRRTAVLGAAAAAGTLAATLAEPAAATAAYTPAQWTGDRLLRGRDRLIANRFSFGVTQPLARQVQARGGGDAWFDWQLSPRQIPDTAADAVDAWFPRLTVDPATAWADAVSGAVPALDLMGDYARRLIVRRMLTQRPVHELMTDLFENHFNVAANADKQFTWRARYGATIHTHSLGRFDRLLRAAVLHPAMLTYLDAAISTKSHPNENLGRELLELHTVGRGHYTEDDVKDSARILTGWHVAYFTTWAPSYRTKDHSTGSVHVMGFSDPNTDPDGRAVTYRYLDYLARHPATARRVARKLAVRFVGDNPAPALITRLARVYLAHDTALAPVLRSLVTSPEFADSAALKVRDPIDDLVASYRVLGVRLAAPTGADSGANAVLAQAAELGFMPMSWPRPDGQPYDGDSWSSPARVLASLDVHYTLARGAYPTLDTAYRRHTSWLPKDPIRFDLLVDHLSQVLLQRRSTAALLQAACEAVDATPGLLVTKDGTIATSRMPRLLTLFLDSPAFFTR